MQGILSQRAAGAGSAAEDRRARNTPEPAEEPGCIPAVDPPAWSESVSPKERAFADLHKPIRVVPRNRIYQIINAVFVLESVFDSGENGFFVFCPPPDSRKPISNKEVTMQITEELVSYVAQLSRLRLNPEETAEMQRQMSEIVS